jgi:error-prone DNA polymerase
MEDRTVIEWDKDDIEVLKMMKVDILGLGMLGCLRRSFDLLKKHKDLDLTIPDIPIDDPAVYDMLCKADSIGVFQVESRAQMSMLPRLKPRAYYDLVIEVAIVRPGPIQGDMVHPYLRRRQGIEQVSYPKDELEAVLKRTLGVPLFQEQAMQIAIVAARFTPGEADKLRRAMATFRNDGTIHTFRERFIGGMVKNGYEQSFAERCFSQIEGFGTYGFPESHAASFAILVCASSWVKCHHPDVFLCAILNAQPMGFYAPAQLIRCARTHGVEVLPVDMNASDWDCTLEPRPGNLCAMRLGFRVIKGMAEEMADKIVAQRHVPYTTPHDVWRRSGIPARQMVALAEGDAFAGLGLDRRQALWAVKALHDAPLPLFTAAETREAVLKPEIIEPAVALQPLTRGGEVAEDYCTLSFSLRDHPLKFIRGDLERAHWSPLQILVDKRNDDFVRIAGLVLVRQRPGTASGIVFVTLEDETGQANLVVWSSVFEQYRSIIMSADLLACCGTVQQADNVTHVVATRFFDLSEWLKRVGEEEAEIEAKARDLMGGYGRSESKIVVRSRDFH